MSRYFVLPLLGILGLMVMSSAASAADTGKIHGVVNNSGGSPAAGVEVKLYAQHKHDKNAQPAAADASKPKRQHEKALQTTTSGADGSFTFNDVKPGEYAVSASAKGQGHARAKVKVAADQTATVTLTLKQSTHTKQPAAASVR